tara:strand:+ start:85 stop:231 length:147 start_codon:yes stop_codon:yes gene_type:complete
MSVVDVKSTVAAEAMQVAARTAAVAQKVAKTFFMSFSGNANPVAVLEP